jgi:hypothetical protein
LCVLTCNIVSYHPAVYQTCDLIITKVRYSKKSGGGQAKFSPLSPKDIFIHWRDFDGIFED